MNKKKMIENKFSVDDYFDVGTIDEWISTLNILKEKYDGSSELIIDSGYNNCSFILRQERLETDDEFNKRIENEQNSLMKEKDKRKKLYEKLKKEFE